MLHPDRLPTPPAVALQLVNTVSRPDCTAAEIVRLLTRDPALCGKLLQAVNSCVYGLSRPVASLHRAVAILGLSTIRSLALGLSLPAMQNRGPSDEATREYWVTSVGGAVIARELAVRNRRPAPDDDLVAGLLRDLGSILLRQTYPDEWKVMAVQWADRLLAEPCEAEVETFGVCHADVSAELLRKWNLPNDIVEPIRHHHHPEQLAGGSRPLAERAELLYFAELLTHLEIVVRHPEVLDYVLTMARERFNLPQEELIKFLQNLMPKFAEFSRLLNQDVSQLPDFSAALVTGGQVLIHLAIESSRSKLNGDCDKPGGTHPISAKSTMPAPWTQPRERDTEAATLVGRGPAELPEFRPGFVDHFPITGCRLGDYELREPIGRGAMGIVYKAYEPSLDRFVAIKLLSPALAAAAVHRQRFTREARVAAALRHENVVGIYAVREVAGLPFLAMEYIEGQSLDRYILTEEPLGVSVVARIGRQLAEGLAVAHARGIIHRDIKPANILLESQTGRVKITDFGLARTINDSGLSREGTVMGTPNFMAPEQARGLPASPESDLFALGGVLYALWTGVAPFPGNSPQAVLQAVCETEPTPPGQVRDGLPSWLEGLIIGLLRKNPAERFGPAKEVARLLAANGG